MSVPPSEFERRMRPFIALQACVNSFVTFVCVFVQTTHGSAALVRFVALLLTSAALSLVTSYALGMRLALSPRRMVQAGFALPAVALWWAEGRPDLLAVGLGAFVGLSWGARHWLEFHLLADADRDGYASHAIALGVGAALISTLGTSALLSATHETRQPVYALFALVCAVGALPAAWRIPTAPAVALVAPWAVLRQPAFAACAPLLLVESGLLGIGVVLTASGAVRSLESASHYGWAASAATLTGALALWTLRRKRHSENRVGWMAAACVGVVGAAVLLGASAVWPALFVLHLLLQAAVGPFWAASEHVMNQRALDIHGSVGDRIAAREGALGVFRLITLGLFWWATQALDDRQRLVTGAALMGAAALLEFWLGSTWLGAKRVPGEEPAN